MGACASKPKTVEYDKCMKQNMPESTPAEKKDHHNGGVEDDGDSLRKASISASRRSLSSLFHQETDDESKIPEKVEEVNIKEEDKSLVSSENNKEVNKPENEASDPPINPKKGTNMQEKEKETTLTSMDAGTSHMDSNTSTVQTVDDLSQEKPTVQNIVNEINTTLANKKEEDSQENENLRSHKENSDKDQNRTNDTKGEGDMKNEFKQVKEVASSAYNLHSQTIISDKVPISETHVQTEVTAYKEIVEDKHIDALELGTGNQEDAGKINETCTENHGNSAAALLAKEAGSSHKDEKASPQAALPSEPQSLVGSEISDNISHDKFPATTHEVQKEVAMQETISTSREILSSASEKDAPSLSQINNKALLDIPDYDHLTKKDGQNFAGSSEALKAKPEDKQGKPASLVEQTLSTKGEAKGELSTKKSEADKQGQILNPSVVSGKDQDESKDIKHPASAANQESMPLNNAAFSHERGLAKKTEEVSTKESEAAKQGPILYQPVVSGKDQDASKDFKHPASAVNQESMHLNKAALSSAIKSEEVSTKESEADKQGQILSQPVVSGKDRDAPKDLKHPASVVNQESMPLNEAASAHKRGSAIKTEEVSTKELAADKQGQILNQPVVSGKDQDESKDIKHPASAVNQESMPLNEAACAHKRGSAIKTEEVSTKELAADKQGQILNQPVVSGKDRDESKDIKHPASAVNQESMPLEEATFSHKRGSAIKTAEVSTKESEAEKQGQILNQPVVSGKDQDASKDIKHPASAVNQESMPLNEAAFAHKRGSAIKTAEASTKESEADRQGQILNQPVVSGKEQDVSKHIKHPASAVNQESMPLNEAAFVHETGSARKTAAVSTKESEEDKQGQILNQSVVSGKHQDESNDIKHPAFAVNQESMPLNEAAFSHKRGSIITTEEVSTTVANESSRNVAAVSIESSNDAKIAIENVSDKKVPSSDIKV